MGHGDVGRHPEGARMLEKANRRAGQFATHLAPGFPYNLPNVPTSPTLCGSVQVRMGASDDPHDCTVSVAVPLQISTDIAPQSQSYWQLLSPFVVAWDLSSWGNVRARRRDAHTPMARRPLRNYLRTWRMRWALSPKQLAHLLGFQTCAHLSKYEHAQDRKRVVKGESESGRVALGGRRKM